nr:hypothetical protein ABAZ39_13700 [Azospirillum argentinense]
MRPVSVLPFASTGTVVSSPCNRFAASTCAASRSSSGFSTPQAAPTWSAAVDRLIAMPSLAKRSHWRFSG